MKRLLDAFSVHLRDQYRWRLVLFAVLALAITIYCVYLFAISLGRPYMGLDLVYENRTWTVSAIDTNGLASRQGVKLGDRPVEINGRPAREFLQKYEKTGTVYSNLIRQLTVVDELGNFTSLTLEGVFPFRPTLIVQISNFIVCLFFWVTGFFVFFKRPRNKAARLLCDIGVSTGILFCGNMAGDVSIQSGIILSIIASIVGPWLLLHFFLVLPEEREWAHKSPLVYLIYLPPLITLVLFPFFGFADGQPLPGFRIVRFLEIGAGLIGVVAVVFFNYVRSGSTRTRQQMKIILIACLAALIPILLLYLLPQMILKQNVIPPGYSMLFLIFFPMGTGIAVITQRLLDIDFVIRRGVIYFLISVVMAAILSSALFSVLAFQLSLSVFQQVIIVLCLGFIATALFGPTKKGIELLIDKLFYKDRYDVRLIIQSFSTSLNSLQDIIDVSRLIVGTMVQTFNLAGSCLFVKSQAGFFEVSTAQGIFAEDNRQKMLSVLISQNNKRIEFPNSASFTNPEVAFLIPLTVGTKNSGVLCLSQKVSRQDFSLDDIFLLQGLKDVASTALDRAMLNRDVSLRNTFVSIASHELRIPLSAIMGYAELMLMRETPEESRKKWLARIISQGQKINSMVDDLLNVSRIQSGKVSIKMEGVDLEKFLTERLSWVQESDNKHTFALKIEPALPMAFIDRDKFGQVVGNLLSNAVKFSPKGGLITLSAREDSTHHRIVVSVADEGMGIGPEDRASLFTTFHRVQRPETQGIRGSGLGLYIVKEWSQAMGGEVWLESELNQGSTFFVAIRTVNSTSAE
jgi:signal transduction histidine kinase